MSTPTLPPLPVLGWASSVGDLYHTEDEASASLYGGPAVPLVSRADATTHAAAIAAERAAMQQAFADTRDVLAGERAVIAALRAEVEALRVDAERYRFLAPRLLGADFNWNDSGACVIVFEWPKAVGIGGNCDMNIDAARAKEPQ